MFDAHHPAPLAIGTRVTLPEASRNTLSNLPSARSPQESPRSFHLGRVANLVCCGSPLGSQGGQLSRSFWA
jgi:hypothetical protein